MQDNTRLIHVCPLIEYDTLKRCGVVYAMLNALPVNIQTYQVNFGPQQTIHYPQVSGMQNYDLEKMINRTIMQQTKQLIQQQAGNIPTPIEEMIGSYEIKNNQRNILSMSLSNYAYHYHAAHGMTYIKSLTFDLKKGKLCALQNLFKRGSDYVERLSAIIESQIKQRNIPLLNGQVRIGPNQDFYIADKALVIYFQLYEITPYVFGFPMFPISVYDIQDIIDENGPLGRMAVNN